MRTNLKKVIEFWDQRKNPKWRIFTVAFLLFLAPVGALTLRGNH